MATSEIRVSVDEEAVARAAATIREAGRQLAEALQFAQALAVKPSTFALQYAQALAVEPWRFYSPAHQENLISYLDDRNQVRHCREAMVVPDTWRKIYVEKKA